ncbi:MAG: single-stranded-DNA-specific exonuclease RecJ [Burkholderiaceae bacterium]|nr:single-stranded-DNA-specific exonuclease RecJ [Burkholderiaceae bacterium]
MNGQRTPRIVARVSPAPAQQRLLEAGIAPVLARLYAARGIDSAAALSRDLARLLPPQPMKGLAQAAGLLADAIAAGERLCVVADYDCDGATACAVVVRGLRMLGARADRVDYLVPNRFEHGYGLSPAIVELAAAHPRLGRPDWLITVDSGIASVDGVDTARALGMRVIVTDHHLPGERLPAAEAIVDPNQPGCGFASRNLAGVGVAFYLLLALRAALRARDPGSPAARAPLQVLLDLVAIGTVADLVPLDENNRRLVAVGLRRIRAGRAHAGVRALLRVAGRDASRATSADFGFAIGPRINAAGRLADISLGIECLLADDESRAHELALALDAMNRERRGLERTMREEALAALGGLDPLFDSAGREEGTGEAQPGAAARNTFVLYREHWHEGLVGLVAGRLKDRLHRPVVALAPSASDAALLRGSGRSIPGVHLRDALDWVDKKAPGLLLRFGGHAMAAGLTIGARRVDEFAALFDRAVQVFADPACFAPSLLTDGRLDPETIDAALVASLDAEVWGQAFPPPLFHDDFDIARQAVVAERHLRIELRTRCGRRLDAIAFGRTEPLPARSRLAYRLLRDDYRGVASARLVIEAVEPLDETEAREGAHPL